MTYLSLKNSAYRGNKNLKRSNIKINFTEEQIIEFIKCSLDPIYFIEKYVKVVHVDKGLIPMILYPYQKQTILMAHENRKVICKFPRQSGKSTCIAAYALHQITFRDDYNVLIAANKGKTAQEIMKKVQTSYEHLPNWLQQGIVPGGFNKSTIEFENGSRCMATSTSADSARGFSFNCVSGDTTIEIRNKITGEIKKVNFDELAFLLNKSDKGENQCTVIFTE